MRGCAIFRVVSNRGDIPMLPPKQMLVTPRKFRQMQLLRRVLENYTHLNTVGRDISMARCDTIPEFGDSVACRWTCSDSAINSYDAGHRQRRDAVRNTTQLLRRRPKDTVIAIHWGSPLSRVQLILQDPPFVLFAARVRMETISR